MISTSFRPSVSRSLRSAIRGVLTVLCLLLTVHLPGTARAASISVNPGTANVGQTVTATVTTAFVSTPACSMQINFGDGSAPSVVPVTNCSVTGSQLICADSATHVYNRAGTFTVQTSQLTCNEPQTPASTTVTVTGGEKTLEDGVVGMNYLYRFDDPRARYQVVAGTLPRGLSITRAVLQGTPEKEGRYRFQVRATSTSGSTLTWYNLRILKARLTVTVSPTSKQVARNRSVTFPLTWSLTADQPLQDTITSSRGLFLAGNRTIGSSSTRLSVTMTNGRAQVTEQVTVPLQVILAAQRMKADTIRYQRTFTARYMDARSTSSMMIAVNTGFTLTSMRIYFTDGRPGHRSQSAKKFVKRNEKGIHAAVDIRYQGAGLLTGYWQADDRILARVTRNLPFSGSSTLTLTLPKTPPLPTQTIGSHRLRFVVTNPPMDIDFPQVIYVVTGEDLARLHPIHLVSPADRAEITPGDLTLTWTAKSGVSLYRIEFFDDPDQDPLFTAFSKKTTYSVPAQVLGSRLQADKTYSWRVIGLDSRHQPVAASRTRTLTLLPETGMVSGRILLLVARKDVSSPPLAPEIMSRYGLSLHRTIPLTGLGHTLVILSTSGDPATVTRQLLEENGISAIDIQPDYLYSTLGAFEETQNIETLRIHLDLFPTGRGKGIRIAVIDTGVDLEHRELKPVITGHANFVPSPYRGEIHGTAVAGIIAAANDGHGTAGIAPLARLLALRACEQVSADQAQGRCSSSSLLQALDRAARDRVHLVNMSLGAPVEDRFLSRAMDVLDQLGITVLAPAGNDPHQERLAFPASHPRVISVAGRTETGHLLPNARVARLADIVLPAQMLLATIPGDRTTFMSGTSMATASATGLLADFNPDPLLVGTCRQRGGLIPCLAKSLAARP